jgi:predicted dehydrogenase
VQPLVDRVISVDEAPKVYRALADGEGDLPLGVVIRYADDTRDLPEPADATRVTIRGHRRAPSGPLGYALVGAGAFGTAMLVPQMQKRRDRFFLKAVVSRNAVQGGNFARANQVALLTTNLDDVLSDSAIDLVVISTRHHEHADQVVRALDAGKHVFVEKPLALSWTELEGIASAYGRLKTPPMLMVGFNRRFSPALTAVKDLVAGRRAPLIINYRLNGGYISLDHWVQGPQGGGRNIGEACHMYDVFRFLAAAPAASVSAAAIDPGTLPYLRNDNFSAAIAYEDGSLGTLLYTALGPKTGLGKERIEIFCDGETYVVDDFKQLTRASDGSVLWQSGDADKGHFEELSRFGDAIASGGESPIPFDEIVETSAVSLEVEDLLFGRAREDRV